MPLSHIKFTETKTNKHKNEHSSYKHTTLKKGNQ